MGLSNGVDTSYFSPADAAAAGGVERVASPLRLVFTGVLDYTPNVEGIDWFCRSVLPEVQRELDVELAIVGRRPHPRVLRLAGLGGVDVVGEVPDVRPYLQSAHVAISPLKLARGIQNKVLEAMASGLPVVLTSQSAQGIDARPGVEFAIADSVDQWCGALLSLARDSAARREMGGAARELVVAEYSWDKRISGIVPLLNGNAFALQTG